MICCDRPPHKHGKDRQGYQRWKCPTCGKTFSDNPQPKKSGRKPISDRPMTVAERKRKQRSKNQENVFSLTARLRTTVRRDRQQSICRMLQGLEPRSES